MVRVYSSFDLTAVHHRRNLLEAEGIRAVVKNELLSSVMGELPPAECQAELWVVDARDAERAQRILREGRPPIDGSARAWRCPMCGEPAEPQFVQCWRCGAFRDAGGAGLEPA